jgi:hypothetical protein
MWQAANSVVLVLQQWAIEHVYTRASQPRADILRQRSYGVPVCGSHSELFTQTNHWLTRSYSAALVRHSRWPC